MRIVTLLYTSIEIVADHRFSTLCLWRDDFPVALDVHFTGPTVCKYLTSTLIIKCIYVRNKWHWHTMFVSKEPLKHLPSGPIKGAAKIQP